MIAVTPMENLDEKKLTDIDIPVGFLVYICRVQHYYDRCNRHVTTSYETSESTDFEYEWKTVDTFVTNIHSKWFIN